MNPQLVLQIPKKSWKVWLKWLLADSHIFTSLILGFIDWEVLNEELVSPSRIS